MTTPSFRDVEQLSASLDGQLSQAEKTRLEARIQLDPALVAMLADLSQARTILHRTPKRPLPRNFTLTHKMAGVKPPVPRIIAAFSWASAAAMLLFVFTLGANLIGRLAFGAAAPMMAAAPNVMGGGIGGGPGDAASTQAPLTSEYAILSSPTPGAQMNLAPHPTLAPDARTLPFETRQTKYTGPVNLWYITWLLLAILFLGAALLIRWYNILAFHRKSGPK